MALPEGATRALRRVSGTLLPIAALAVGGYLVYHAHRLNALVERDQRAIASMGAQIRGRLDAIATVIATDHRNCATAHADVSARRSSCRGDDVGGIAVQIAARVMAEAEPGNVVVSRTRWGRRPSSRTAGNERSKGSRGRGGSSDSSLETSVGGVLLKLGHCRAHPAPSIQLRRWRADVTFLSRPC